MKIKNVIKYKVITVDLGTARDKVKNTDLTFKANYLNVLSYTGAGDKIRIGANTNDEIPLATGLELVDFAINSIYITNTDQDNKELVLLVGSSEDDSLYQSTIMPDQL